MTTRPEDAIWIYLPRGAFLPQQQERFRYVYLCLWLDEKGMFPDINGLKTKFGYFYCVGQRVVWRMLADDTVSQQPLPVFTS